MKRWFTLFLSLMLAVSIVGCSDSGGGGDDNSNDTTNGDTTNGDTTTNPGNGLPSAAFQEDIQVALSDLFDALFTASLATAVQSSGQDFTADVTVQGDCGGTADAQFALTGGQTTAALTMDMALNSVCYNGVTMNGTATLDGDVVVSGNGAAADFVYRGNFTANDGSDTGTVSFDYTVSVDVNASSATVTLTGTVTVDGVTTDLNETYTYNA